MKLRKLFMLLAASAFLAHGAATATATTEYTSWTYDLNYYTDTDNGGPLDYPGNDLVFSAISDGEQLDVTVTGWKLDSAFDVDQVTNNIAKYGTGLGINLNEEEPWHAIDNKYDDEFLLFDFGEGNEVALKDFTFGYARERTCNCPNDYYHWADATVLRYIGDTPDDAIADLELYGNGLTAAGFELVGHYLDVPDANLSNGVQPSEQAQVQSSVYSRFWAIGTYIESLGDITKTFTSDGSSADPHDVDHKFDAAKLAQLTVHTRTQHDPNPSVPVPTTLALMSLGAIVLRRKSAG